MHAICNHVVTDPAGTDDTDCNFHLFDTPTRLVGGLARTHETDTGHMVTLYRNDTTVPRGEWATSPAEWELSGADTMLFSFEVAERLAGLIDVAATNGDLARVRDLAPVLLNGLTVQTNAVATADPRRYADVARLAQSRVNRALTEVAGVTPPASLRGVLREGVLAA